MAVRHAGRAGSCVRARAIRSRFGVALILAVGLSAASLSAQDPSPQIIVGNNSNMLGGEQILRLNPFEVRGDILGRADNEPSCAISTRNPNHILCGANTYRMVDVPGVNATSVTRDAWQGDYQSANGGETWESTLHPGFFLDPQPHIFKLLNFRAAADATVRSGVAGMAWHSGIAFKSDKSVNSMFVSTFADLNNRENDPMPFKYVWTAIVDLKTAPKFIDKPWITVEAAPPGQMCTIVAVTDDGSTPLWASTWWGKMASHWLFNRWPGWLPKNIVVQQVPASIIHVVYSIFLDADETKADLMYSKSTNCGLTFSVPKKISAVQEPANGASIAKPLVNGSQRVYAVWRRVNVPPMTAPHAILATVSNNNGGSWSTPKTVANICPFEQGTTPNSFRTTAFPTMTADASGRAYVAWVDRRDPVTGVCHPDEGRGRIMVSTSADGVNWSQPQVAVPSSTGEHQIFPSIAFTAGKLFLAWVDFKEDVSGVYGRFVDEANLFLNGLPVNPPARRHTGDVRLAVADPGVAPNLGNEVARVSRYLMGRTPSIAPSVPGEPIQLQWNAYNRRWARKGEVPFVGDYIDIATRPYLPPDLKANPPRPDWTPNNGLVPVTPSVLITWSDNRDMRDLPPSQLNPNGSVPFAVPANVPGKLELPSGPSIVDPTQNRPVCEPGSVYKTGTTNQNVYAARAIIGFAASTPSGNKNLGSVPRSFVVYVRNDTDLPKSFRLQIAAQPPGGIASFDQFTVLTTVDLNIPRHSSVARTVFVRKDATPTALDPKATIRVNVTEMVNGAPAGSDSIYLNADRSAPEIDSPEIDSREIFLPEIDSPEIDSIALNTPEIDSPEIDSPEIDSETLKSLGLQAPEIDSPEIDSPEIDSQEVATPEIDSPEIDSAPITDVKVKVTNTGNTTAQYDAKSLVRGVDAAAFNYQLIVRRKYDLRAVGTDCLPTTVPVSKVLVNLLNVTPESPEIDSPEIDSSAPGTAAFYLAPGETGEIIVRARKVNLAAPELTKENVGVATQQKAVNTDDAARGITEPPVITSFLSVATSTLPAGRTGSPYSFQVLGSGGTPPYTFSRSAGTLPPGLTLTAAGLISGTPTTAGVFPFTVNVQDSSVPTAQVASRELSITITQSGTASLAFVTQPSDTLFGRTMTPPVSVRALAANSSPAVGLAVTVAIANNPAGGVLSGTLTAVTNSNGIAVFPNLTINNPGAAYTLRASASGFPIGFSTAFDITAPDLIVGSLSHTPENPVATDTITFTAMVKNNGTGPADPSTLMFKIGGETAGAASTLFSVPALAPGSTHSVQRQAVLPAQAYINTATADYATQVAESNEGNNTTTDSYIVTSPAGPLTFTVSNTNDSGAGSLRQALLDANANGGFSDTIVFTSSGTIVPQSPLPTIVDAVTIDATAGFACTGAAPAIELDGGPGEVPYGLRVNTGATTIRGLAITRFGIAGIFVEGGTNNVIECSYLGLPPNGALGKGNGTGILLSGASGNIIGGTTNATRNVISGNSGEGVRLQAGSTSNQIRGNFIGTDPAGTAARGNFGDGVHVIDSATNTIGGASPNVVSANGGEGIRIDGAFATGNVIQGNFVGTDAAQTGALGNQASGIFIRRAPANLVRANTVKFNIGFAGIAFCGNVINGVPGFCGGNDFGDQTSNGDGNAVHSNVVQNNAGIGVSLDGVANTLVGTAGGNNITSNGNNGILIFGNGAAGNQIISNAINGNTGDGVQIVDPGSINNRVQSNSFINNTDLAVDLNGDGVTTNDGGEGLDNDPGPNNLQNFPDISLATTTGIAGTLSSAPGTVYSLQLYSSAACDASGFGEGQTVVALLNVTTDALGLGTFSVAGLTLANGTFVTATATDPGGNTSEFSACAQVQTSGLVDALGDSNAFNNPPAPDLYTATGSVNGGTVTLHVRYAPGTYSANATQLDILLDTDESPATGFQGTDSSCSNDASVLGSDYMVRLGGGSANLFNHPGPASCVGFGFVQAATLVTLPNGVDVSFPLTAIGGDDGQMNFKVITYTRISEVSTTGIQDRVSDLNQPAGHLP